MLGIDMIVFAPRMRVLGVVDMAGAGQDEPGVWRVSFCGGSQIACSLKIAFPDKISVLCAKHSREMHDG